MRRLAAALAAAALAGLLPGCMLARNARDSPGHTAGHVTSATSAARLPPEAVPPYFLALTRSTDPAHPQWLDITVRASFSGQVLATVLPPENPGTFAFAGASISDGRTFLVGAQPWNPCSPGGNNEPVSFYLLRFDPASRRTSLTQLPVPAAHLAGPILVSAELSPDGTRLAVAEVEHTGRVVHVHVYRIPAGGRGQRWTVTGRIASDLWGTRLSWSANDHVLAVGLAFGTVRLLNTAAGPGRAAAVEDITLGVKDGYECDFPVLMTSDGRRLICGVAAGFSNGVDEAAGPGRGGFAAYDIRTGDLTAVLGVEGSGKPGGGQATPAVLWASPRGTLLIGRRLRGTVSLLAHGRYQPIAWGGLREGGSSPAIGSNGANGGYCPPPSPPPSPPPAPVTSTSG